jgi:phage/conjugal plasmid C-4 type zinc finger TraR family protein
VADFCDEANEITEAHIEKSLAKRVVYKGVSEEFCLECGTDIPEARRVAIPGCKFCVDCQELKEKGKI